MYIWVQSLLTFRTIDDLIEKLAKIGKGAHIHKIDVTRAFRHLPMDQFDYDLMGLY